VEDRAHVEHILFKTIGKTDAEVAEIHQQAEDVLNKIKHGANFEDLAKKYSEDDATKPKGGDLGWIVKGQTVPAFQQVAFSQPKGTVSDLVKTEYGFHILKVLDRETAHTKPLAEVRNQIVPILLNDKIRQQSDTISDQMAAAVRQSNRQSLDDIARKFNLTVGVTPPAPVTAPVGVLGNSPEVHQVLFELRPGELSEPISLENGVAILTVKDIQPAHQGTLAEVHDRVLSDYQQDKSLELARQKADELSKEAQSGQEFDKAAKSLDLTTKTPDAFARTGSVPDVGAATFLGAAFTMPVGQVSKPTSISGDWLVYRVVSHQAANPAELATQTQDIESQLMQSKQTAAFDAFHTALEDRLRKEGKITINADIMKRFTKTG
ncbi:MAG: peptidylprolyl isomerase, partial [Blastocatellia bacterium]